MSEKTKQQLKNFRDTVLNTIQTDKVTMHSRYYFLARTALWVLGIILAFGTALFLLSFVAFVFQGNGLYLLPQLGFRGFTVLFMSLPWLLLLLIFMVFVVLQVLSTHFAFVYKRPLIHTILGSIFLIIIGSALIAHTPLHDRAYTLSNQQKLPIAGSFYRDAVRDKNDVHIGTIENLTETSFTLHARGGEIYTVFVSDDTRKPPMVLGDGAVVMVLGVEKEGAIQAHGIRPFDDMRPPVFPSQQTKRLKESKPSPFRQ